MVVLGIALCYGEGCLRSVARNPIAEWDFPFNRLDNNYRLGVVRFLKMLFVLCNPCICITKRKMHKWGLHGISVALWPSESYNESWGMRGGEETAPKPRRGGRWLKKSRFPATQFPRFTNIQSPKVADIDPLDLLRNRNLFQAAWKG